MDNDKNDKKVHVEVETDGGGGWIAIALIFIYFWSSEGVPNLHEALVHFLMK
jgi:hypothetical protein